MKKIKCYFIPDDSYGQRGCDIQEIQITQKDYKQIENSRIYLGKYGFITKSYTAAYYYIID